MRRSVQPVAVRKYLSAKLADFEHEVFAVLFLDTQHRLIEYSELLKFESDRMMEGFGSTNNERRD